jgi:uroporphyrinogen decarboxylase
MGAIAFNHSCGNITELLPDYIEAGLDGWQSLEPASLIDHVALKKKYGDKFLFVGGLDSREISFGTKDSIRKHVRSQVRAMGNGGGYIPGPTHDFLTETPLDNCIAMRDAVQQEGKYPL